MYLYVFCAKVFAQEPQKLIRKRQIKEDKVSIKNEEIKKAHLLLASNPIFQSSQIFQRFQKNIFLSFTTIFTFKRAVLKIKDVKKLRTPNIRHSNRKKSPMRCSNDEGSSRDSYSTKFPTRYCIEAPERSTINPLHQSYFERGHLSYKSGNEKPKIAVEKQY